VRKPKEPLFCQHSECVNNKSKLSLNFICLSSLNPQQYLAHQSNIIKTLVYLHATNTSPVKFPKIRRLRMDAPDKTNFDAFDEEYHAWYNKFEEKNS